MHPLVVGGELFGVFGVFGSLVHVLGGADIRIGENQVDADLVVVGECGFLDKLLGVEDHFVPILLAGTVVEGDQLPENAVGVLGDFVLILGEVLLRFLDDFGEGGLNVGRSFGLVVQSDEVIVVSGVEINVVAGFAGVDQGCDKACEESREDQGEKGTRPFLHNTILHSFIKFCGTEVLPMLPVILSDGWGDVNRKASPEEGTKPSKRKGFCRFKRPSPREELSRNRPGGQAPKTKPRAAAPVW